MIQLVCLTYQAYLNSEVWTTAIPHISVQQQCRWHNIAIHRENLTLPDWIGASSAGWKTMQPPWAGFGHLLDCLMKFSIDWLPRPPRDHRRQCLCCIRVSTASKHQNAIPRQRARSPAIRVAARSVSSPMAPLLLRIFCAGLLQVGVVAKALTRRCWLRGSKENWQIHLQPVQPDTKKDTITPGLGNG